MMIRTIVVLFLITVMVLPAAQATEIYAGWVKSDVGLAEDAQGLTFGVSKTTPIKGGTWDYSIAAEYVQKGGSHLRWYSDATQGVYIDEAEVTLHIVQPAIYLGANLPLDMVNTRIYGGFSYALIVSESWDNPDGSDERQFSFDKSEPVGSIGIALSSGSVLVDARYSLGFSSPLTSLGNTLTPAGNKAEDDGIVESDDEANTSCFQITAGWRF